jgi:hypothetical protein
METDHRIAGNNQVLAEVEAEIVAIEQMFTKLESLENEKTRLAAAVENLTADETRTLADDAAESVVVKKLIEIRARKDVQSARLTSTQDKIKELTADLSNQGANVRRAFQVVVGQLWTSRQTRTGVALRELFGSDWIVLRDGMRYEMKFLAKHTQLMKEIRDFDVKVSHEISDPEQEVLALSQRSRLWLTELTDLVNREPGLVLRTVPAKQKQPIEMQPVREMAIA